MVDCRITFACNPHELPWGMSMERVPNVGEFIHFIDADKLFRVTRVDFFAGQIGTESTNPPMIYCDLIGKSDERR